MKSWKVSSRRPMVNGAAGLTGQLAGQVHSAEEDLQQEAGAAHHRGNIV